MARVTSLQGKAVGKVGSMVYSVVGGQMVAREYQPNVANPNTQSQVDQRARLKLASQIAAALSPVIAIPKEGLKSSRNLFIKKNMGAIAANDGVAQVTYENLQLTAGNAGIPAIHVRRSTEVGVHVNLEERADGAVTRMVYILYRKTSEATLQYVQSIIVEAAGTLGNFPGSMLYTEGDIVVFAYGIKDLNARAHAAYSDYNVQNGEDIAKLTITRKVSLSDYQFTMTRGTTLFAGESESAVVGANQARVYVTPSGNGTVAGAGVFDLNSQVTVTATPGENATFVGWRLNGSEAILSTQASYTFTLEGQTDLVAVFQTAAAAQTFSVTVASNDTEKGTVSASASSVEAGHQVTLTATPIGSNVFKGWRNSQGQTVSDAASYTFVPNANVNLTGYFGEDSGGSGGGDE